MSLALVVDIIGDASKLSSELDKSGKDVGGWADKLGGSGVKVAALAGAAGVAAVAIADMTQAAAADRDEAAKLETAIKAAGAATGDYTTQVEDAITAGQAKAFSDSETRAGLQSLVVATHDVGEATDLLALSQDVARYAGVDLATAADAVAKAQSGQGTALQKLIPGIQKSTDATVTLAQAQQIASGQADAYAASTEGQAAMVKDSLGELSETIGSVFLPILDAIVPALLPILKSFGTLVTSLLPILIPLVKLVAAALTIAAQALSVVVGWLVKLVEWITTAIGKLGDFLAKINPLSGIKLPSLPSLGASPAGVAQGAGIGRAAASSSSYAAPATINVYTTGDGIEAEQAVVRALRRVTRINGGVVPAVGWAGR